MGSYYLVRNRRDKYIADQENCVNVIFLLNGEPHE